MNWDGYKEPDEDTGKHTPVALRLPVVPATCFPIEGEMTQVRVYEKHWERWQVSQYLQQEHLVWCGYGWQ